MTPNKLNIIRTVEPETIPPYNEWMQEYKVSKRVVDPTAYDKARDMMRQYRFTASYINEAVGVLKD